MEQTAKPAEAPKPRNKMVLYAIIVIVLIVVGVSVYILTLPKSGTTANILIQDDSTCGAGPPGDTACLFNPITINATVNGPAIVWQNNGGAYHTVTTCDSSTGAVTTANCPNGANSAGLDSFNSGSITLHGGTFSHVFTKAGTYYYYCNIHPWMHGVVIAK